MRDVATSKKDIRNILLFERLSERGNRGVDCLVEETEAHVLVGLLLLLLLLGSLLLFGSTASSSTTGSGGTATSAARGNGSELAGTGGDQL